MLDCGTCQYSVEGTWTQLPVCLRKAGIAVCEGTDACFSTSPSTFSSPKQRDQFLLILASSVLASEGFRPVFAGEES